MKRRRFLSCALVPVAAVLPIPALVIENPIDALLRRFLEISLEHLEATGIVMHPIDWTVINAYGVKG